MGQSFKRPRYLLVLDSHIFQKDLILTSFVSISSYSLDVIFFLRFFEGIILSEISQAGKDKYCMISLICGILKKNHQNSSKSSYLLLNGNISAFIGCLVQVSDLAGVVLYLI